MWNDCLPLAGLHVGLGEALEENTELGILQLRNITASLESGSSPRQETRLERLIPPILTNALFLPHGLMTTIIQNGALHLLSFIVLCPIPRIPLPIHAWVTTKL